MCSIKYLLSRFLDDKNPLFHISLDSFLNVMFLYNKIIQEISTLKIFLYLKIEKKWSKSIKTESLNFFDFKNLEFK